MSPTSQAVGIQRALRGTDRTFAMSPPPSAIALGAAVNGINTDPCTYLLLQLASRYSESEDERSMILGTSLVDFRREGRHESIDSLLTRWDLARTDAATSEHHPAKSVMDCRTLLRQPLYQSTIPVLGKPLAGVPGFQLATAPVPWPTHPPPKPELRPAPP